VLVVKDRFYHFRVGFFVLYNFYDMCIRIMIRRLHNDDKISVYGYVIGSLDDVESAGVCRSREDTRR
jgi:hypothetical protein